MDSNKIIKDLQSLEIIKKYRNWKPVMEKYSFNFICEVGVMKGTNFKLMIEHNPTLAVAVDSWIDDGVISRNDCGNTQNELNSFYNNLKNEMSDKPFVKICRGYSFDVVKQFPDEYFDIVYVDADHTYEGCLRDMKDWYPKVKPGGFLLGDDYVETKTKIGVKFGVIEAVKTFLNEKNLNASFFDFPRRGWGIEKPKNK